MQVRVHLFLAASDAAMASVKVVYLSCESVADLAMNLAMWQQLLAKLLNLATEA